MEDLAYLYLVLNKEVEHAQRGFDTVPVHLPTARVAPVQSDRTIPSQSLRDRPQASTVQSPDFDLDCPAYPSFYL